MINLLATTVLLSASSLNWSALNPAQTKYSTYKITDTPAGRVVQIATANPGFHLSGLVMQTGQGINSFVLDKGIFTGWRFIGSTGSDSLTFGPQGAIISKRNGGVVDFGVDNSADLFKFTNRIDVKKCSEKHGIQCHPLNHLQRVVIRNFGREDTIDLQGKIYKYDNIKNGVIYGVPPERLRVEVLN